MLQDTLEFYIAGRTEAHTINTSFSNLRRVEANISAKAMQDIIESQRSQICHPCTPHPPTHHMQVSR